MNHAGVSQDSCQDRVQRPDLKRLGRLTSQDLFPSHVSQDSSQSGSRPAKRRVKTGARNTVELEDSSR